MIVTLALFCVISLSACSPRDKIFSVEKDIKLPEIPDPKTAKESDVADLLAEYDYKLKACLGVK